MDTCVIFSCWSRLFQEFFRNSALKNNWLWNLLNKICCFYLDKFELYFCANNSQWGEIHFQKPACTSKQEVLELVTLWYLKKTSCENANAWKQELSFRNYFITFRPSKCFFGCGRCKKRSLNMGQKGNTIFFYFLHWHSISWYVGYYTIVFYI